MRELDYVASRLKTLQAEAQESMQKEDVDKPNTGNVIAFAYASGRYAGINQALAVVEAIATTTAVTTAINGSCED